MPCSFYSISVLNILCLWHIVRTYYSSGRGIKKKKNTLKHLSCVQITLCPEGAVHVTENLSVHAKPLNKLGISCNYTTINR